MAVNVNVEANINISFGLESQATELVKTMISGLDKLEELVLKIANVNSSVWCGVAFLRGHGGTFQPIREMRLSQSRDVEWFESAPSHQFKTGFYDAT